MWAALRDAGIEDEVRALPDGLDTRLAADGSGLSIGQLQRLSLARALMSPVDVVLLDEPTAALDPSTEKAVADAIGRLAAAGATVIVVAHRPALIEVAHQIVRIEQQPAPRRLTAADVLAEETPRPRRRPSSGWGGDLRDRREPPPDTRSGRSGAACRRIAASWPAPGSSGAIASLSAVALLGTSAWLISTAAEMPPVLTLTVAAVMVRFLALSRALFRYAERLVGHDAAFRGLTELRVVVYSSLERLAPTGLSAFGRGDLLARLVADVDAALDLPLRVILPWAQAVLVAAATVGFLAWLLPVGRSGHRRAVASSRWPSPRGSIARAGPLRRGADGTGQGRAVERRGPCTGRDARDHRLRGRPRGCRSHPRPR